MAFNLEEKIARVDYLIEHPDVANDYAELKAKLSQRHGRDRIAYHRAKTEFVMTVTEKAKQSF